MIKAKRTEFLIGLSIATLLGLTLFFRIFWLGTIPGVNGDEASSAAWIFQYLDGGSYPLHTQTGRILDPIFLSVVFLIHQMLVPSFFVLRISSVVAGCVCILFTYVLLKKSINKKQALLITLLVASLPIHIGFSRYAWEPSWSPLACLLSLYFALSLQPTKASCAFLWALIVHPTNIFLAPFLLAPFLYQVIDQKKLRLLTLVGTGLCFIAVLLVIYHFGYSQSINFKGLLLQNHVFDGNQMRTFMKLVMNYVNGVTLYQGIIGSMPTRLADFYMWLTSFVFLFLLGTNVHIYMRSGIQKIHSMTLGLLASLVVFFVVAGPNYLSPGMERYGLWMTIPFCVWGVLSLDEWGQNLRFTRLSTYSTLLVSCFFIFSFYTHYFHQIQSTNSTAHPTFISGPVEPKYAAFQAIDSVRDVEKTTTILALDHWTYWPILYLTFGYENYNVTASIPELIRDSSEEEFYYVGWSQHSLPQQLVDFVPIATIKGFGDVSVFTVYKHH